MKFSYNSHAEGKERKISQFSVTRNFWHTGICLENIVKKSDGRKIAKMCKYGVEAAKVIFDAVKKSHFNRIAEKVCEDALDRL